jgi:hypothetical protein
MLHIRYSPPRDLELSASPAELLRLSAAIAAFCAIPKPEGLCYPADSTADPAPYTRCLAGLRIRTAAWPARLAVDGDVLELTGSPETLDLLCSFLESAAETGHAHYEYYEGNDYISADSLPLVVRGE